MQESVVGTGRMTHAGHPYCFLHSSYHKGNKLLGLVKFGKRKHQVGVVATPLFDE